MAQPGTSPAVHAGPFRFPLSAQPIYLRPTVGVFSSAAAQLTGFLGSGEGVVMGPGIYTRPIQLGTLFGFGNYALKIQARGRAGEGRMLTAPGRRAALQQPASQPASWLERQRPAQAWAAVPASPLSPLCGLLPPRPAPRLEHLLPCLAPKCLFLQAGGREPCRHPNCVYHGLQ